MNGAEVWGCNRNVDTLQQVQLEAAHLFLGVGTCHESVPAVGAGRPASGLDSQSQMCHILVQGPHQPNV